MELSICLAKVTIATHTMFNIPVRVEKLPSSRMTPHIAYECRFSKGFEYIIGNLTLDPRIRRLMEFAITILSVRI